MRRRRSTLGGNRRSFTSVGGRLSLAGPAAPCLEAQILSLDEDQPWDTNLNFLLDIALREAARRLETRLPGDECVSELRADVVKQSSALAKHISERLSGLTPAAADDNEHSNSSTSAGIDAYKKKTKALEQEYSKWKAMSKKRIAECRTAEMEFKEAKTGVTTMYESLEHLSPSQQNLLDSWPDCSLFVEEAHQAKEKAHIALEEVRGTTQVVNGLLTASKLQADWSYTVLENLTKAHVENDSLSGLVNSLMQQHMTCSSGGKDAQSSAG